MGEIKKKVQSLIKKYNTDNPYEIAGEMGIRYDLLFLGTIRGYYTKIRRIKIIHINNDLTESEQRLVCAHELGHAILHPNLSTPFFEKNTLFSKSKFEKQANIFAAELLLNDKLLEQYNGCSIQQIAESQGYDREICKYKLML